MSQRNRLLKYFIVVMAAAMLVACEKNVVDEATSNVAREANALLQVTTRGTGDATISYPVQVYVFQGDDCKAVQTIGDIAIFDAEGTKVKTVAQKEGDASYGTVALSLAAGTYRLVVIAHNCDGSATITSTEKVTFPNNKVTDTYYYCGDLVVGAEKQSYDLTLTRAVAMFRLVLTDESIPSNVAKLKFYYLGGSSTFSPKDGYGCVQSKQTEIRPVAADGIYEIYTLPHTEEDVLTKLTVTALDANDNILKERVFENVPVIRNQVTRYTGSFFDSGGGNSTNDGTFRLTADPDWDSVNGYNF